MGIMNSRERVNAALEHRMPDRVPVDLGSSIVTGINAMGYARLKRLLGLPGPARVTNAILLLAEVEPVLLERWGIDLLPVPRYFAAPEAALTGRWSAHPLPDGTPALFPEGFDPRIRADGAWELYEDGELASVLSPGSGSFVPARFPLAGATLEGLEAWQPPRISDEELEFLHRTARRLYEETDKALFGWFNGSIFEQSQFLCGWEEFLIRLYDEPRFTDRLLDKLTAGVIADLELYLDAVGKYIQVIGFGDDFGFQGGLQLAPSVFRQRIKPHLARIYGASHALSPARVFLHSCGSVYELIEDFIEIGVEILNPVQTSAADMEPERLKAEFGERICFWGGGADVQQVLPLGTPEEVRRDVRRRLELFGKGGGFVFAPIHNIQADVPPENVAAMYGEAAARA
jgi:uroporphyrinogen decarboxylase